MRRCTRLACGLTLAAIAVAPACADTAASVDALPRADVAMRQTAPSRIVSSPWHVAQGSRDALFGTDAPAETTPARRLGGYVEGIVAYTYADPSHWSRGAARLHASAQGELADDVKWRIGGRVEGDAVFAGSDFYLDPVKRDQRFDVVHGETYIDFSRGDWTFRLGAQHIIWGEVVGLFFADVVSARDMREFLLPRFDVMRIPQWAARAEYFAGDSHLELVWIPVPLFDRIGKPGSDFYPAPLPSPTPEEVAELFRPDQRPSRSLRNSNYGVRANTLVEGWDLSAFYYRSFATQPTFHREASADPARPFEFVPRHDRISQVGATLGKAFGDFVLRGEAVYTRGQRHTVADLSAERSVVDRSTFDYILGLEWSLPRDTRLNVQGFQRVYSGGHDDLAIQQGAFGVSVFVSTKLTAALEPQLLWIQYVKDGGGMIRPRLTWSATANSTVSFGVDIFTGPSDGYFGRYDNRDRVYVEARHTF